METLTFEEAWAAYRRAEVHMPAKAPPVTPRVISGVLEVADAFDLVVLDAWGVLNLGSEVIPTAPAAFDALRRRGKRLMLLSNDGSSDKPVAVKRHGGRGFVFAPEDIIMGVDLLSATLAPLGPLDRMGVIGPERLPLPALTGQMVRLATDRAAYDRVDVFVFMSIDEWDEARQAILRGSLAARPRPLIVCNPDIAAPLSVGMSSEPGYYGYRLLEELGTAVTFCGKPFAPVYDLIRARHPDVPPERVLCVGDSPHTDILGARAAGFRALLVEGGFCRDRALLPLCEESGIWPDFLAPRL